MSTIHVRRDENPDELTQCVDDECGMHPRAELSQCLDCGQFMCRNHCCDCPIPEEDREDYEEFCAQWDRVQIERLEEMTGGAKELLAQVEIAQLEKMMGEAPGAVTAKDAA